MTLPSSIVVPSSPRSITAFFAEATEEQKFECYKLGATGFRHPLPAEQYIQREQFVDTLPLTQDKGWRFWCLYNKDDPNQILSTCKTIVRDLNIRDATGVHRERGYCIASVVTDSAYWAHGLASFLLKKVAEWMDGPGQGAVSFLYSRLSSFYEIRGWEVHPSLELLINLRRGEPVHRTGLPSTRLLEASDVPPLCDRDMQRLVKSIDEEDDIPDAMTVAVLPTHDLVSWLHGRGDFYASTLHGKVPEYRGSIDEMADVWIYWHHDFRRDQLIIQRISRPKGVKTDVEAITSLLLDARAEALAWNLSAVSIWSPDQDIEAAGRNISALVPNDLIETVERKSGISMVRLSGGNGSNSIVYKANEFYAWN